MPVWGQSVTILGMSSRKKQRKSKERKTSLPPIVRVGIALAIPLVGILFFAFAGEGLTAGPANSQGALVPLFVGMGIVSLFLGMRWYGLKEMGLRGGRPLFSSIGFAVMGWVVLLITRFFFVKILGYGSGFDEFFYRFLFEAFCVQLWAFGLLFRSVADWRGPLTATIASGLCFGLVASLLFAEAPDSMTVTSLLYFILWGVFYGMIRLRTGNLTGMSLIQALQSFTVWVVLTPDLAAPVNQFASLYLVTGVIFLILIWRLWPKEVADYRV